MSSLTFFSSTSKLPILKFTLHLKHYKILKWTPACSAITSYTWHPYDFSYPSYFGVISYFYVRCQKHYQIYHRIFIFTCIFASKIYATPQVLSDLKKQELKEGMSIKRRTPIKILIIRFPWIWRHVNCGRKNFDITTCSIINALFILCLCTDNAHLHHSTFSLNVWVFDPKEVEKVIYNHAKH